VDLGLFYELPRGVQAFAHSRFTLPQAVYIIARLALHQNVATSSLLTFFLHRISSLAYVITNTVFQGKAYTHFADYNYLNSYSSAVGSVEDCSALQTAIGWCVAVAIPSNSLLFFFRIRAVFFTNRLIVAFFALIWASTLSNIVVPFSINGTHIGPTKLCVNSEAKSFSSVGIVASTVNDTLVFFATTLRIMTYNIASEKWSDRWKAFVKGEGLSHVPKVLLQTGQLYYL
jgi:hypothetical protein